MSVNIYTNPSFSEVPLGLKLQQTITSSGSVTIPSNIKKVFAICVGGGGSGAVMPPYTTASITNVVASSGTVTYTCSNSFVAGALVTITGVNPTSFNLSQVIIATASSTQFTVTSTATGTYVSGGTAASGGAGGGGGAGGITMGWTYPSNTCVVAAGAVGQTGFNNGSVGGITQYGTICAGGGSGASHGTAAPSPTPSIGGAGGGQSAAADPPTSQSSGATSYYGQPAGFNFQLSYGGTGGTCGINSTGFISRFASGVAGGGGGGTVSKGSNMNWGQAGLFGFHAGGGGGAGYSTTGTSVGGEGGRSDFYIGGSGSSGSTNTAGAGGGGAGIAGNGSNASGITGGNGGLGGGGGGAGGSNATTGAGGSGGAGIIYLYY